MGEFAAVTAFRTDDADRVLAAAGRYFSANAQPAEPVRGDDAATDDDVLVFPPDNGWTVVLWPGHFTELAAVKSISRDLGVLTSTVRIHDGAHWTHALLRDGVTLDRFATLPDQFTDDPARDTSPADGHAGQPAVVADAVGCPVEQVAPYLVRFDDGDGEGGGAGPGAGRAFPDDEFELDSPWVFIDFWRRLGARCPDDLSACHGRLRLAGGWSGEPPAGDAAP